MKNLIQKILPLSIGIALLSLVSCAGVNSPISDASILRGKRVVPTTGATPPFTAMTPSKALLGGGELGMILPSGQVSKDNDVRDPAGGIADQLASEIHGKLGTQMLAARKVESSSPKAIAKACADADYALDVRTVGWGFSYFPFAWGTYRVFHWAKLQVIDCKTGQAVASGVKSRIPSDTTDAPSYDELTQDHAARIKRELQTAASEAAAHFKSATLKL